MTTHTEKVQHIPTITENLQREERIKAAVEHGSVLSNEDAVFLLTKVERLQAQVTDLRCMRRREVG